MALADVHKQHRGSEPYLYSFQDCLVTRNHGMVRHATAAAQRHDDAAYGSLGPSLRPQ